MDVIVYGTGKYGDKFIEKYSSNHNIRFWVDGNKEKQGETLYGIEIKSPYTLKEYLDTPIVIAIRDDFDVRMDLIKIGCKEIYKFIPGHGLKKIDGRLETIYNQTATVHWGGHMTVLILMLRTAVRHSFVIHVFLICHFSSIGQKSISPILLTI